MISKISYFGFAVYLVECHIDNTLDRTNCMTRIIISGTVYKKEMFQATLAVKGSILGRAPVAVAGNFVALADRSGMNVNVFNAGASNYPLIRTLSVRKPCIVHEICRSFISISLITQDCHDMLINAILVSGDGTIISSGWDCQVVRWNAKESQKSDSIKLECYVNTMSWVDQKDMVFLVGGKSGYLAKVQFD